VTLEVSTDVPCDRWRGALITIARPDELDAKPVRARTSSCEASGRVGSLVLVPSAAGDEAFGVKIVGGVGRDPAECVPPAYGPGCIVAKRTLSFVADAALTLPVSLKTACDGVRCGARDTCAAGKCRSAAVPDPAACVGAHGCEEGVLGPPGVADCAELGQPADASCWDVSASFSVANYTKEGGLNAFGKRAVVGQTAYAYLDATTDATRSSAKVTCGGASMDELAGFDIERYFDAATGTRAIKVSGKSLADCGRPEGGSQCAGSLTLNAARGWRIAGGRCNVTQGGSATTDALGRPVHCRVDAATGTVSWQAGTGCGDCCACPDATAYVDILLTVVK